MIRIDIVDYENLSKTGYQITEYVNNNLRDIIRVLLDYLESDEEYGLDGFFPRDYLKREPQECRDSINELYEIICSKNIRDFIKPKYEYLLYSILCWWDDCADDEDELILNTVDDELLSSLNDEEGKRILNCIQDYEEYYNICFLDHDFLPEQLSSMVMLYIENPRLVEMFFQYDNLDDYIDLMECDLRERYLEIRNTYENDLNSSVEQGIVSEIINLLKRYQQRVVHFEKRDEVEITSDIHNAIEPHLNDKYELIISREFTMGRAIKKLGETDLYIFSEKNGQIIDYAILENKNIEKFTDQYYQLMGYLNQNFKFGITLSLNRNMSLIDGIEEIEKKLVEIQNDDNTCFAPVSVKKYIINQSCILVSEHIVPETKQIMKVYHLIFQIYDDERKTAASVARGKKE